MLRLAHCPRYRLYFAQIPCTWRCFIPCRSGCYPGNKAALEDALRTIRLVRSRAKQLNIDPHKIGVLGFSAGGHLVAATSTLFDKSLHKPVDATDKLSARPDFAIALYPGHSAYKSKGSIESLCTRDKKHSTYIYRTGTK